MAKIDLIDTTIRDGNQSLWGATGLTNAMIHEIAPVIDAVGFHALDFVTSTHLGTTVRYHKENPWERISRFHERAPNTRLGFLTSGLRFISWETASLGLMELALSVLVRKGVSRFQVVDPMNNMESIATMAKIARHVGGEEIVAGVTYTVSDIHDDAYFASCAKVLSEINEVDRLYLKDPGGLLTPERARTLIPAIKQVIGSKPLEIHSHCNLGLAPISYLEAANGGAVGLHVAMSAAANGSSQPSAERIISNLKTYGHTVDVDEEALAKVSAYFRDLAAAEGLPVGLVQEFDAAAFKHQIPGGVLGTMRRQLKEIQQLHKLDAVIEEVAQVRKDLGYPIMVTPFSQVVVAQSVMNVISPERYANVPDEVIRYVTGKFGTPSIQIDPNVLDRIMTMPRTKELAAEAPMPDVPELRRKLGTGLSDEELVLRAVMPAEQVDAMLANRGGRKSYNPKTKPLISLIKAAAERKDVDFIEVKKSGFSLTLKSDSPSLESPK